jgi:bifunctional DNase/RNase
MLIMQTADGSISFPIIIAANEASALLKELEVKDIKRPHTHDLLYDIAIQSGLQLLEIHIHNLSEGIFFTRMLWQRSSEMFETDSRPSDAIILATKYEAPMYIENSIVRKIGVPTGKIEKTLSETPIENENLHSSLDFLSIDDLQTLLEQAVDEEDFETASQIRDLINEKKQEDNA